MYGNLGSSKEKLGRQAILALLNVIHRLFRARCGITRVVAHWSDQPSIPRVELFLNRDQAIDVIGLDNCCNCLKSLEFTNTFGVLCEKCYTEYIGKGSRWRSLCIDSENSDDTDFLTFYWQVEEPDWSRQHNGRYLVNEERIWQKHLLFMLVCQRRGSCDLLALLA